LWKYFDSKQAMLVSPSVTHSIAISRALSAMLWLSIAKLR